MERICDISVEVVRVKEEPNWDWSDNDAETQEALAPAMCFTDNDSAEMPATVKEELSAPKFGWHDESAQGLEKHTENQMSTPVFMMQPVIVKNLLDDSSETLVTVKEEPSAPQFRSHDDSAQPSKKQKDQILTPVFMMQPEMMDRLDNSSVKLVTVKEETSALKVGSHGDSAQSSGQNTERQIIKTETPGFVMQRQVVKLFKDSNQTVELEFYKTVSCDICNKEFKGARNLQRHMAVHAKQINPKHPTSDASKPFYCERCKKHFSQLLKFIVHLQQHDTKIPYCTICYKEFATQSRLVKHNRSENYHRMSSSERFAHKVGLIRHNFGSCVNPSYGVDKCEMHSKPFQLAHKRINILRR